jgi:hypothetical protein
MTGKTKQRKKVLSVPVASDKTKQNDLRHQLISEKAYELYQKRGCCDGCDLDDWLEAERLITVEVAARTTDVRKRKL